MVKGFAKYDGILRLALTLFVVLEIIYVATILSADSGADFGREIRVIGAYVVLFTAIYKFIITGALLATGNKDSLDRAWNWCQGSIAIFFLYLYLAIDVLGRGTTTSYFWSTIWYQILVQMFLSCGVVLYYFIRLRLLPIFHTCTLDGEFCGWKNLWLMLHGEDDGDGNPVPQTRVTPASD